MDFMPAIGPLYSVCGFVGGLLVGMTGAGGGSLMTPLLILVFGVHPATAVGTDLFYSAATKTCGSLVHALGHTVDWKLVRRLAAGSLPSTALTLFVLSHFDINGAPIRGLITTVLNGALLLTAGLLIAASFLAAGTSRRKARRLWTSLNFLRAAVVSIRQSVSAFAVASRPSGFKTKEPTCRQRGWDASVALSAPPLIPLKLAPRDRAGP
jgi:uncharacterized membrane protein YfcA